MSLVNSSTKELHSAREYLYMSKIEEDGGEKTNQGKRFSKFVLCRVTATDISQLADSRFLLI